ncbi:MAG TPA: sigma 54-interacting transcriptional regulator [Gammaproteobacteria bacterium]|nr:sigma 54-interacting transcriptional regulator [Gammaproteobacteria bacterium]
MRTKPQILLVDDDPGLLRLLSLRLESNGYAVRTAKDGAMALAAVEAQRPDLVITDLRMENMDGLELLEALVRTAPGLPVILITAHGSIPDAVRATQNGAFGFLTKPVEKSELLAQVERALETSAAGTRKEDWREGILTRSGRMEEVLNQAKMAAGTDAAVLITGESGTGKEQLARSIHRASPRASGPFVAVNCAAIPETLLESELFGHEKGAFTGAVQSKPGLVQEADGGTLFLDEIGDMPPSAQVKLLRVLQEGTVRPVGSTRDRHVDIRVISATHQDLRQGMESGEFREDLFYRLNVVNLRLPPLRERREDIPLLATHFLDRINATSSTPKSFAPAALEALLESNWPGNVRELQNFVERCAALTPGQVISAGQVRRLLDEQEGGLPSLATARDEFTRRYLAQLLRVTRGNVSRAARMADRNRTDFYKLLKRFQLDPSQFKDGPSA